MTKKEFIVTEQTKEFNNYFNALKQFTKNFNEQNKPLPVQAACNAVLMDMVASDLPLTESSFAKLQEDLEDGIAYAVNKTVERARNRARYLARKKKINGKSYN